jgi:hypothetical protein
LSGPDMTVYLSEVWRAINFRWRISIWV